jgi:uncharacterized membrane protein
MLMTDAPFGVAGYVLLGCWIVAAVLVIIDPKRFFRALSFGRVSLPSRFVGIFRVLGLLNVVGSVYLIVRYATGA